MSGSWTPRDWDIAETLTRRVRLLSLGQIRSLWWPRAKSFRIVRRRLRKLVAGGLIQSALVNAHPPLDIQRPLVRWRPGETEPDFEPIAQWAQSRWPKAAIPQTVFFASRLMANVFGSSAGQLPPLDHRDHDLLLGEVYTLYRTQWPVEARQWVGEDSLPKAGYRIKDPDAFLVSETGRVWRVIESAGRYSARQCLSFHAYCAERNFPYELW